MVDEGRSGEASAGAQGESQVQKLLFVDDEENVLVGMRRYFRSLGFDVDCASEREEAEALAANVRYDGVVVDLCLTTGHGPDGLEVIRWVREHSPSARILVLTAFGAAETQREALKLGADLFLQKPRPLEEIHHALAGLLRSA